MSGEPQQTCSFGMMTRIPLRLSTSIASSAVRGRRRLYIQPTKNPTVAFTGPVGSITSAFTSSRKVGSVRTTERPVSFTSAATSLCRGSVSPFLLARDRRLLYCFARDLDLLRADLPAGLAACAGKEAFLHGGRDAVIDVSRVEREAHFLTHSRRSKKLRDIHRRAD